MENKDKCIILKRKEYDDLVEKANGNKPAYIQIDLYASHYGNQIRTNLEFSERLDEQLRRLIKLALNQVKSEEGEIMRDTREDCYKILAGMSWYQRRKFLKQYE